MPSPPATVPAVAPVPPVLPDPLLPLFADKYGVAPFFSTAPDDLSKVKTSPGLHGMVPYVHPPPPPPPPATTDAPSPPLPNTYARIFERPAGTVNVPPFAVISVQFAQSSGSSSHSVAAEALTPSVLPSLPAADGSALAAVAWVITHDDKVPLPDANATLTVIAPVPELNDAIAPVIQLTDGLAASVILTHCPTTKFFPVCTSVSDLTPVPTLMLLADVACDPGDSTALAALAAAAMAWYLAENSPPDTSLLVLVAQSCASVACVVAMPA